MSSARTAPRKEATSRTSYAAYYPLHWVLPPLSSCRDSQIADQIDVMNKDYASVGLSWVLANTTRTVNADWFDSVGPDSSQQTHMKATLRQGGVNDLNVYSVGFVSLPIVNPREVMIILSLVLPPVPAKASLAIPPSHSTTPATPKTTVSFSSSLPFLAAPWLPTTWAEYVYHTFCIVHDS